jgi:hypothetical protein
MGTQDGGGGHSRRPYIEGVAIGCVECFLMNGKVLNDDP